MPTLHTTLHPHHLHHLPHHTCTPHHHTPPPTTPLPHHTTPHTTPPHTLHHTHTLHCTFRWIFTSTLLSTTCLLLLWFLHVAPHLPPPAHCPAPPPDIHLCVVLSSFYIHYLSAPLAHTSFPHTHLTPLTSCTLSFFSSGSFLHCTAHCTPAASLSHLFPSPHCLRCVPYCVQPSVSLQQCVPTRTVTPV